MSSPLTVQDYERLAELLETDTDVVMHRFTTQEFGCFRVFELKIIIKFFRGLDKFYPDSNPHLRLSGRKHHLIESIISAISYSRQVELANTTSQESRSDDMNRSYYTSQNRNQANRFNSLKTIDIETVVQTPSFYSNRSPFYDLKKFLAKAYLLPNKQTMLSFRVAHHELDRIHRSSQSPEFSTLEVHLRLFSTSDMKHFQWDPTFLVSVNGIPPKIPEPRQKKK